ncbi:hypothetical protein JNUCC1_02078 [Lentibacillus sp. JNUCC-1]|uniref:cupin domain-containing protein n=1 Tax=Lentibacillus sp. JNUCC-1 TaxID=2654513 RepID=UPI0012E7429C|nr:cupin domain-containing protein [Lentibacillus sp. JNUCC-1]MUV38242.1 hypothetical protein [Lentibacillus sp. JNUCC-1]
MDNDAAYWIEKLKLEPHPEGGYYRSTFQSDTLITTETNEKRHLYTSIYFLLREGDLSHFHRLKSDELWYYHAGSPLEIHMIHQDGSYQCVKLGVNLDNGEVPQLMVPKHTIFGSVAEENAPFSLVGCMVSPGFDFKDFELFDQAELLDLYPQHEAIIRKLAYAKKPN